MADRQTPQAKAIYAFDLRWFHFNLRAVPPWLIVSINVKESHAWIQQFNSFKLLLLNTRELTWHVHSTQIINWCLKDAAKQSDREIYVVKSFQAGMNLPQKSLCQTFLISIKICNQPTPPILNNISFFALCQCVPKWYTNTYRP